VLLLNPGSWLRSRWKGATIPVLEWRRPDPPRWSALQTRSASKHSMSRSARPTKHLALADREAQRSFLRSDLAKLAAREAPVATGTSNSLLCTVGFLRRVPNDVLGHRVASLWSGPRGVVATPLGPFLLSTPTVYHYVSIVSSHCAKIPPACKLQSWRSTWRS
jgi:hypothetical protein